MSMVLQRQPQVSRAHNRWLNNKKTSFPPRIFHSNRAASEPSPSQIALLQPLLTSLLDQWGEVSVISLLIPQLLGHVRVLKFTVKSTLQPHLSKCPLAGRKSRYSGHDIGIRFDEKVIVAKAWCTYIGSVRRD
eukprot:1332959-Amorphochlora_amoeboformis.AAC.1